MDDDRIREAERLARLFLERAKALHEAVKEYGHPQPRKSGALRRASIDLTRALAAMRRPESYNPAKGD